MSDFQQYMKGQGGSHGDYQSLGPSTAKFFCAFSCFRSLILGYLVPYTIPTTPPYNPTRAEIWGSQEVHVPVRFGLQQVHARHKLQFGSVPLRAVDEGLKD